MIFILGSKYICNSDQIKQCAKFNTIQVLF